MVAQENAATWRGVQVLLAVSLVAAVGGATWHYWMGQRKRPRGERAATVKALFVFPVKSCGGLAPSSARVTATGLQWDRQWIVADERGRFLTQRQHPRLALISTDLPPAAFCSLPGSLPPDAALVLRGPGMEVPLVVPLRVREGAERVDASVWEWEGRAIDEGSEAATWLSAYLGRPARLLRFDKDKEIRKTSEKYASGYTTTFTDGFPFLVSSQASLDYLNERVGEGKLSINRFRPTIFVEGCEAFEEDTWRSFLVGSNSTRVFHGVKPCGRCRVTATNQETAEVESEPLKTLGTFRSGEDLSLPKELQKQVIFGMNAVCEIQSSFFWNPKNVISVGDAIEVIDKAASLADLTPK